ncbi:MAG: hypothetical protein ACYDCL_23735 [Myxococcales bacterium]
MRSPLLAAAFCVTVACSPTAVQAGGQCQFGLECDPGLQCVAVSTLERGCVGSTAPVQICTRPCTSDADCASLPEPGWIHLDWSCEPACSPGTSVCRTSP